MPIASPERGPEVRSSQNQLYQSLKVYLAAWVDVLRTRLELLSTEIQEEQGRLEKILILGAASVICLAFGLLLVTLFVVVAFWETDYRLVVLGGFAVLYLATGIVVGVITRRKSRNRPKLFAATLGELAKDFRHLSSRS